MDDVLTALFLPSVYAVPGAYERDELERRLTRTALVVKRYRASEGRWPERLSDLAAVGLEPKDWTALQAGPFGSKIEGDSLVLWAYDVHSSHAPPRIPSEPPTKDPASNAELPYHVTRIGPGGSPPPESK